MKNVVDRWASWVKIHRAAPGKYGDDGRWQQSQPQEMSIKAYIEPIAAEDLIQQPEGRRTEDLVKVYSRERLFHTREELQTKGDLIFYDGKVFELFSVETWIPPGASVALRYFMGTGHRLEYETEAQA